MLYWLKRTIAFFVRVIVDGAAAITLTTLLLLKACDVESIGQVTMTGEWLMVSGLIIIFGLVIQLIRLTIKEWSRPPRQTKTPTHQ